MQVFGTMQLTAIRRSDLFYGTGESYLFTFYPEFQVTVYTSDMIHILFWTVTLVKVKVR